MVTCAVNLKYIIVKVYCKWQKKNNRSWDWVEYFHMMSV